MVSGDLRPAEQDWLMGLTRRHGFGDVPVTVHARGGENLTVAVGGWILRRGSSGEAVVREAELLTALAAKVGSLVPRPRVVDVPERTLVYPRLPGEPLRDRGADAVRPGVADAIADVLLALREVVAEGVELDADPYPLAVAMAETAERVQRHWRRWDEILPPENSAVSDPARDLGRLLRDLGPTTASRVAARLGEGSERVLAHARAAWVEDVDDAWAAAGRDAYLAHAIRTAPHVFFG